MKVITLFEKVESLNTIYKMYYNKIYTKINDPYFKVLLLLFAKNNDIKKDLDLLYVFKMKYYNSIKKGDITASLFYYQKIYKKYLEIETKLFERLFTILKIYAYYLFLQKNKKMCK